MPTREERELIKIMKTATSVELHVKDFEPIRKFYKNIGFDIIFDSPGNYLVVRKGNAILNFWGDGGRYHLQPYFKKWKDNTKKGYAVEIVIPVKNIEEYYGKIKNKVKVVEELKDRRWNVKDFRIEDPNGFYIRFTEPHDWIFTFKGYSSNKD